MSWVVDTCVLIDVLDDDPAFGASSADLLDSLGHEGLCVCPITYIELAPAFQGDLALQDEFLAGVGVDFTEPWSRDDTMSAHAAWNRLLRERRAGRAAKRPMADVLIGAFASRCAGLITRNPQDFQAAFPRLELRVP